MSTFGTQEEQPISRTYQYRKVMKPMLERKRRARINRCLDELKELLVGALQAEGESVSRLEKADVLELTVRHLHKLRRSHQLTESSAGDRFRAGFVHCANEVSKYMSSVTTSTVEISVSSRLVSHLDHCIRQIDASNHYANGFSVPSAMVSPVSGSSGSSPNGLNILTTYTPPTSPISSPSNNSNASKLYSYNIQSSSSASSTGSLSPIPAHFQHLASAAAAAFQPQPLALCVVKSDPTDGPFDLSGSGSGMCVWRPW